MMHQQVPRQRRRTPPHHSKDRKNCLEETIMDKMKDAGTPVSRTSLHRLTCLALVLLFAVSLHGVWRGVSGLRQRSDNDWLNSDSLDDEFHVADRNYLRSGARDNSFGLPQVTIDREKENGPDAIVVGSGLAGLAASLTILDRGGTVVLLEKEGVLGGNSMKASSGINACCHTTNETNFDTKESFTEDTINSAGDAANLDLIETLVGNSAAAVSWLQKRVGVDLSILAQLGGHSHKRTHRPQQGMVGAEIIYGMEQALKPFEGRNKLTILLNSPVTQLLTDKNGLIAGVEYARLEDEDGELQEIYASHVVLATGGFASDRSSGSYLERHRPELLNIPTTGGAFATGDGIALATSIGASLTHMEKIQIHPTGWVDPEDPDNLTKVLAAEVLRGVGGILLDKHGNRFCNELGTRAYIADKMMSQDPQYARTKHWNKDANIPMFYLVLSAAAADGCRKHVDMYVRKGLAKQIEGVEALAEFMDLSKDQLVTSLEEYKTASQTGTDSFGKTVFRGLPKEDLDNEIFYAGVVSPVLHYCMGGITIDSQGDVLDTNGDVIPGLHAAGEVTGGVHGNNRLGGNSLLECVVYGTRVGNVIPVKDTDDTAVVGLHEPIADAQETPQQVYSLDELRKHNSPNDLWVAVSGTVFNLTGFANRHPAGADAIYRIAGTDATDAFLTLHSPRVLDGFHEERIGRLEEGSFAQQSEEAKEMVEGRKISKSELQNHSTDDDCWVAFFGHVYDMTDFSKVHPGGARMIQRYAGKDGTKAFAAFHKEDKLQSVGYSRIGALMD